MRLYLRTQDPGERYEHVQYDLCYEVQSQAAWQAHITALGKRIITSVLQPTGVRFPLHGRHLYTRSHKHETHYVYDAAVHTSYRAAAEKLAHRWQQTLQDAQRCLVYLPLRGALPIWRAIQCHFADPQPNRWQEYHAVTSSFVFYPPELEMVGKHGGAASGRFANLLELRRLRDWCLRPMGFDHFVYVDEMISGGMLRGHVNEMMELGITQLLPVTVVALADPFGTRSKATGYLNRLVEQRQLHAFLWEGCQTLISEDQKFLLGRHYVDHAFGPHVVPVLREGAVWFEEKIHFDQDVCGAVEAWTI